MRWWVGAALVYATISLVSSVLIGLVWPSIPVARK
jgi:hypothetical protein